MKLFKEKYSEGDKTSMNMNLFFPYDNWAMIGIYGDDRYSMEAFEADCTADGGFRTWLEYTDNGDLIGVLSCSDNAPWSQSLRASRDCTLAYYVNGAKNVLVDGSNVGHAVKLGLEREVIPGYETDKPDIFVSTDYKPGYTSLIYSVPKDKYELFKKTQAENETTLVMEVWFGDFSEERDSDDELPDSAYHVDFYLTDTDGGEDGYTIQTFAEDNQVDFMPMIEEFYTKDGGYAVTVCFKDSDRIAGELGSADEFRVYYYIQSKGKYVDGSWDKYTIHFSITPRCQKTNHSVLLNFPGVTPVIYLKHRQKWLWDETPSILEISGSVSPPAIRIFAACGEDYTPEKAQDYMRSVNRI